MNASKSLRRPTHWEDFETLCKKLWGEIWNCPEIKKNGRNGQTQHGVDIVGIPNWEKDNYGIQCKGKDEYTHKQFTQDEILLEIENAKSFKPPLKKLYLATTAVKDAKIEEFIRVKNQEHINQSLFEVHIFSWEDIVDLIDENRQTHDWYVNSQNYKSTKGALLTFHDDSVEIIAKVPFRKRITEFKDKSLLSNPTQDGFVFPRLNINPRLFQDPLHSYTVDHSYLKFYFRLHNVGTNAIEDFKIQFEFVGQYQKVKVKSKGSNSMFAPPINFTYDTYIYPDGKGVITPTQNILVGDDSIGFDDIVIKPIHDPSEVEIHWKLLSKDFKTSGILKIIFTPEIIEERSIELVDNASERTIEEGKIEDHITDDKGRSVSP